MGRKSITLHGLVASLCAGAALVITSAVALDLVTLSKIVGRGRAYLSSPPSSRFWNSISVHEENFSKMYAASPTGESFKAQPVKEEENLTVTGIQEC